MFVSSAQPVVFTESDAGAMSTDDVNMYQAVGALTCVSVVGASTLGMAIAAPLPVIGTLAIGGGLVYYGTRLGKDGEATDSADTKSDKTVASVTAPSAPSAA